MSINKDELDRFLVTRSACGPALKWFRGLPDTITPREAWNLCERGDWLLWAACVVGVDKRHIVHAAIGVFMTTEGAWPPSEAERIRDIVAKCRAYGEGVAPFRVDVFNSEVSRCADQLLMQGGYHLGYALGRLRNVVDEDNVGRQALATGVLLTEVYQVNTSHVWGHSCGSSEGTEICEACEACDAAMRELTDLIRELLSWEVVEAALDKQAVAAEGRAET